MKDQLVWAQVLVPPKCTCLEAIFVVWLLEYLSVHTNNQEHTHACSPLNGRHIQYIYQGNNTSSSNQTDQFKWISVLLFISWLCLNSCWWCRWRLPLTHRRRPFHACPVQGLMSAVSIWEVGSLRNRNIINPSAVHFVTKPRIKIYFSVLWYESDGWDG